MIRELIGLYPIDAFLACALSSKHTPLLCVFSSPDQMKSPFVVSLFPVQCTSEIPIISYLKRFISFLSSSNFPAAHNVCTFHVPTVKVFLTGFSLCMFFVVCFVLKCSPVANFSTLSWSLGRGRGPCSPRQRRAGMDLYYDRSWLVSVVFFFTGGGICTPSAKHSSFSWTCDRHRTRRIAISMVEFYRP